MSLPNRHGARRRQPKIDPHISDALRDHALLRRWFEKPRGQQYARQFSQYDGTLRPTFEMLQLNGDREFQNYLREMLGAAETFAVTPDMHELVQALAKGDGGNTIPPSLAINELPAMDGFLRLPEPIWSRDIADVDYPIRAILWHYDPLRRFAEGDVSGAHPVVSVCLFNDRWDGDPLLEHRASESIPGPSINLLHFGIFDIANLHAAWEPGFGAPMDTPDPLKYQMPARYMVLFWLIANQRIAAHRIVTEGIGPITAMQARAVKIVPRVRVITLRRERIQSDPDPDHEPTREYSHRWAVRAHWRHQPCGPGREERKWVLVTAHIRGPDDKPLVVKERAFDLRR